MKISDLKIGQRLVRLSWKDGTPFLQFGTVAKIRSKTFTVVCNGTVHKSAGWHSDWKDAWKDEIKTLVADQYYYFQSITSTHYPGLTERECCLAICEMNRLWRKLRRHECKAQPR